MLINIESRKSYQFAIEIRCEASDIKDYLLDLVSANHLPTNR
jgi:hypothetical protein